MKLEEIVYRTINEFTFNSEGAWITEVDKAAPRCAMLVVQKQIETLDSAVQHISPIPDSLLAMRRDLQTELERLEEVDAELNSKV